MLGADRRQAAHAGATAPVQQEERWLRRSQYPELEADYIEERQTTVENYSSLKFSNLNRKDLEAEDADYFGKLNLELNSLSLSLFLKGYNSTTDFFMWNTTEDIFNNVLVALLHAITMNGDQGFLSLKMDAKAL